MPTRYYLTSAVKEEMEETHETEETEEMEEITLNYF